ncbi:Sodium/sulfate symporter [Geranomyces variabilis]|nr:Sodium/sulfate symporter [Geranomyces variabilis]KAJ3132353.1 low-affinity phosphate transporter [Geranomyces variabilis]
MLTNDTTSLRSVPATVTATTSSSTTLDDKKVNEIETGSHNVKVHEEYPTLAQGLPRPSALSKLDDGFDDDHDDDVRSIVDQTRSWHDIAMGFRGNRSFWFALLTLAVCLAVYFSPVLEDKPAQHGCLVLLIAASMLWALEVFPLFITALLIPLLAIVLRTMRKDGADATDDSPRLSGSEGMVMIFHYMGDATIFLLLGGFTLAAALSKHHITTNLATWVLSKVGNDPNMVLLAIMNVATFSSLWISNVAAPVLCYTVLEPILATLETSDPAARALVLGVALASNIGGMGSPISSPQNAIAINTGNLGITWPQWFAVAIPVALICNILVWLIIVFMYKPRSVTRRLPALPPVTGRTTLSQIWVIVVLCVTVVMWCFASNSHVAGVFGGTGAIGLLPVILLFGTGMLDKNDFNGFMWNVIVLAMGGIALGKACQSSGLLKTIGEGIQHAMQGRGVWAVASVFGVIVLLFATFVSHSVAAAVFCPVVAAIGGDATTPGIGHTKLLVMLVALVASGAMGLPISGFPNLMATALEDPNGKPYIGQRDFVRTGVPCSIVALAVVLTVGFGLEGAVGL